MANTDVASQFWIDKGGQQDVASRHWADAEPSSNERPYDQTVEAVEDDARSAYREAAGRSNEQSELEQARDSIETLRHGFGSLRDGIAFGDALTKAYQADPIGTREWHRRAYAKLFPRPMPEKPRDEAPPDYLDVIGLRNWQADEDVKRAYRDAAQEKAHREDIEAAAPAIAALKQTYPDDRLGDLLDRGAGVHLAMGASNGRVADKLAMTVGAPVNQAHANDMAAAVQAEQRSANLSAWIGDVENSGVLPGFERTDVQDHMIEFIEHMNKTNQRTGNYATDLEVAHRYATARVQEQVAAEQAKAAAEKARHASRSISGSSGSSVSETANYSNGSVEDDARAAYNSVYHSTRV